MMEGKIDWAALPLLFELLDIENPELFIDDLMIIRDHMRKENANG